MRTLPRLVLFLFCYIQCGLACSNGGLVPSTFSNDLWRSSWTMSGGLEIVPDPFYDSSYSVQLAHNKDYGLLRSIELCPVPSSYCLQFIYNFTYGGEIDLSVYVNNSNNGQRVKLWSLSSPVETSYWNRAIVPLYSEFNFTVELEAVRRPSSSGSSVYSSCSLYPSDAVVTTPPATATNTTTAAIITTTISTPTTKTTSVPQHSITSLPIATPDTPYTPELNNDSENTASIGTIIGPIIAALVIIVVVIIIVLYRRNKLPEIQTCFNRKQASSAKRGCGSGDGNAVYVNEVTDDDDDDTRMAVQAETGDYAYVAESFATPAAANTMTRDINPVVRLYVDQTPAQGPHDTPSRSDYVYLELYGSLEDLSPPNPYETLGGSTTENYSSLGGPSPPNTYATLGATPTENVYSDEDPTSSENTHTGLGARSPPNVYLSIGQIPDHSMEADTADDDYLHPI